MNKIGTSTATPLRRHLLSPQALAPAANGGAPSGHRQGNGLRVHAVYFAVVSLAGLALIVFAVATSMR